MNGPTTKQTLKLENNAVLSDLAGGAILGQSTAVFASVRVSEAVYRQSCLDDLRRRIKLLNKVHQILITCERVEL